MTRILISLLLFTLWESAAFAQPPKERVMEGDMNFRPDSVFTLPTPAKLWTNSTVPYVIDADIPNPTRLTDAIAYYNANTPVKFQARVAEANFVHMVRSTVGNGVCSSNVGMIGGEQFIHVEDACNTSTLIHEMGHTVGFFHEQSRSDRNRFVTVLFENIDKNGYSDYPVNTPPVAQDIGAYDFASHMHYSTFEFSVNNLPTLQTVPAGIPLNPYAVLSPGDLDTLFRLYATAPTKTTVVTNPPGLQLSIDGQVVASPQVLSWPAGSTHSVGVATQTSNGVRYSFGSWSDGGTSTHTITSDPSITVYSANFVQQVPVSVGVATSGGGTVALSSSSVDGYFATATVLQMTATPSAGYSFLRWSGGTSCPRANAGSPTTIVVSATAINCVATFTQAPVTTILTDPFNVPVVVDGSNYVQTPVNLAWSAGTSHTIATAAPASNPVSPARYIFQNWSDGGAAAHTVTAGSGAATIKATFTTQYSLVRPTFDPSVATFTVSPESPDNFFNAGATLQISAAAGAGWTFFQWMRDLAGQPNPGSLTMNSQMAFGALFYRNPPALAFASAASYANAAVAPGEIIVLFGNGIGPATLAGAQLDSTGKLSTSVAGTAVTFNGIPAPIVYASSGQTSVVVPYGVAGQSTAAVAVQFNGKVTNGAVAVDTSGPGFFTSNARGNGGVAAANQDGTLNTPGNPARKGSIVTFYATGAGQLSPAGVDGAITAAPLPVLTQPVSVRIGGKPAQLQYAGPAPAQVSGVLQINAVVPADAPTGDSVSAYLVIGNNASPVGTTVAVQ